MKVTAKADSDKTLTVERHQNPAGLTSAGAAAHVGGATVTLAEGGITDAADSVTVKLVAAITNLNANEYIKTAANEYLKVTNIADAGKTLTV